MNILEKQSGYINGVNYEVLVVERLNRWFVAGMALLYVVLFLLLIWLCYLKTISTSDIQKTLILIGATSLFVNFSALTFYLSLKENKPKSTYIRFMVCPDKE
jgi:predicted neutral ceramidase superfamily lipid hydrolase